MSGFYNGAAERDTPERILARAKGEFRVSLRWRDDWLRRRCDDLKRQGLLVGGRRIDREVVYYPATSTPAGNTP